MLNRRSMRYPQLSHVNVGQEERLATLGVGLVLVLGSLWRKSLTSLLMLPVGLYLLYRSASGHCHIYQYLGISTVSPAEFAGDVPPTGVGPYDEVAESSWESFPTSDAPAWTMGKRD